LIAGKRSLTYSALAHMVGVLIVVFGFPSILNQPDPEPFVMSVEIVPIGAMTNLPSQDKPLSKWQQASVPKTPKPVTPTIKEEKKPTPKPESKKDDVPLPEPDKPAEIKPEEKPASKKEEKNEDQEKFEAILKSLKEQANEKPKKEAKDEKTAKENKTRSDKPYDPTLALSITEKDAIRGQFVKCWRMPAGAKDAEGLAARVRVSVSPSGEVTEVRLATNQLARYRSDEFFRAAADSAIRAVWKCSPLQNLPSDKYETWQDMELNFDPREMLY
jgi:hypothetical protein